MALEVENIKLFSATETNTNQESTNLYNVSKVIPCQRSKLDKLHIACIFQNDNSCNARRFPKMM